jgi:hypothetical protein
VVIFGNSRRQLEEISEFIDHYPNKYDQCGVKIKPYEKDFDEHVVEYLKDKEKGYLLSVTLWLL